METENKSNISAKELWDTFKNEQIADTYYQKMVTIKGFVTYAGPDMFAIPSVELSEEKDGTSRTICLLPFGDYLKLRKLTKGNELTIRGEARGLSQSQKVVMKHCQIVD